MVAVSLSRVVRTASVGGGWGDWSIPTPPFCDVRSNGLQSGDEVSQKARGVAIRFVQRQPSGWPFATGDPFAKQRGFAKAGGGGDEGQFAGQTLVETPGQAGTEDGMGPRWGDIE